MNKYGYKLIRGLRKLYLKLHGRVYSHQLSCCEDAEDASRMIMDLLEDDKPCMIARYGATELLCVTNYLGVKGQGGLLQYIKGEKPEWWWTDIVIRNMCQWSGFYPATPDNLSRFSEMMLEDTKQLDLLGCWDQHESLYEDRLNGVERVHLRLLEPFWSKKPWTHSLKGKKVLVVHPFAEEIEKQYTRRNQIFPSGLLPDFDLITIKAVQSLGGGEQFQSWFDALDWMKAEIDKHDYDICLIGCGAYGFPLAAHVKRLGKKAFHLGGALQLVFGIRGRRWENPNYGVKEWGIPYGSYSNLMNDAWVRPGDNLKSKNSQLVEDNCYW